MTENKPWRAAYWPKIIEEQMKANFERRRTNSGGDHWPYFYDANSNLRKTLGMENQGRNQYLYINSANIMEAILAEWENLPVYSRKDLTKRMKSFENVFLMKAIYTTRKEEFDALVAEINS
jgi:hypothetical protein